MRWARHEASLAARRAHQGRAEHRERESDQVEMAPPDQTPHREAGSGVDTRDGGRVSDGRRGKRRTAPVVLTRRLERVVADNGLAVERRAAVPCQVSDRNRVIARDERSVHVYGTVGLRTGRARLTGAVAPPRRCAPSTMMHPIHNTEFSAGYDRACTYDPWLIAAGARRSTHGAPEIARSTRWRA